jgi:hypothetical protein
MRRTIEKALREILKPKETKCGLNFRNLQFLLKFGPSGGESFMISYQLRRCCFRGIQRNNVFA